LAIRRLDLFHAATASGREGFLSMSGTNNCMPLAPGGEPGANAEPPELPPRMSVDQGLEIRATSVSGCQPSLSQPERKLLGLQPKSDVGRQEETREQQ
jgi:hypothetical protein